MVTTMQDALISSQRREIAELRREVKELSAANMEIKRYLAITLEDTVGYGAAVINPQRFAETVPEFELRENYDGDLLIRLRRLT